jgi:NADH dehydrogenase [ubiquinone] 1 alpha subcomplex assembly factor 7
MGMHIRVQALKSAAKTEARKGEIDKAASRLVDTLGMGKEYQVLGITSHGKSTDDRGVLEAVWPFMDIEERSRSR